MNHVELHEVLSKTLKDLQSQRVNVEEADAIFKGSSKLISNCKNEIKVIELGFDVDVPLMGITKDQVKEKFARDEEGSNEKKMDEIRKKIKF
jgi:hypothetical protein